MGRNDRQEQADQEPDGGAGRHDVGQRQPLHMPAEGPLGEGDAGHHDDLRVLDPQGVQGVDRLGGLGGFVEQGDQSDRVIHIVSSASVRPYSISAAVGTSRRPIRRRV